MRVPSRAKEVVEFTRRLVGWSPRGEYITDIFLLLLSTL